MFTPEERDAVIHGEEVSLDVEGTPCVVVRRDVFDRLKQNPGQVGVDVRGTYAAVMKAWDQEPDPALHLYQKFRRKP